MGDFDSEIYRAVYDMYSEVMKHNEMMKQLIEEVKGLRRDIQNQGKMP